jgi:hypothetical protein
MLAELPNSALKRQLGIGPGQEAAGRGRVALALLDRLDYLPAVWLVLARVARPTPARVLVSVALVAGAHHLTVLVGYRLGLRPVAH